MELQYQSNKKVTIIYFYNINNLRQCLYTFKYSIFTKLYSIVIKLKNSQIVRHEID